MKIEIRNILIKNINRKSDKRSNNYVKVKKYTVGNSRIIKYKFHCQFCLT